MGRRKNNSEMTQNKPFLWFLWTKLEVCSYRSREIFKIGKKIMTVKRIINWTLEIAKFFLEFRVT